MLTNVGYLENRKRYYHENSYFVFELDGQRAMIPTDSTWAVNSTIGPFTILDSVIYFKIMVDQTTKVYKVEFSIVSIPVRSYDRTLTISYATFTQEKKLDEKFIPSEIARVTDIDHKLIDIRDNFVINDAVTGYHYLVTVEDGVLTATPRPFEYVVFTYPDKTSYTAGEVFDNTGLSVRLKYDDNTTAIVKGGYQYSKDSLTAGMTSIAISSTILGEVYTTTVDITVTA